MHDSRRTCLGFWGLVLALAISLCAPTAARAQGGCPAAWVPGIGTIGLDNGASALVALPNGDVIVGGDFTSAGGTAASRIARFHPTTGGGGVWSALGSGLDSGVRALAALPGGDVLAGGIFTMAGGAPASKIARYNSVTGVWSALGSGVDNTVWTLAVLPGGDVIVGGDFTTAGGVAASRIARYNLSSGGSWSALGSGTSGTVLGIAMLPGGDLIVGGDFTTAGGVAANRIARYNPVTGIWSALGSGLNDSVISVLVLPGGDVIAAGRFLAAGSGVGGVSASRIARYSFATGLWSALGSGTNSTIQPLALNLDGDVIVGGAFSNAGGITTTGIARYNPTTGMWSALGSGTDSTVRALAILPGGDVVAAGIFSTAGSIAAGRIARYFFGSAGPTITTQPLPVVTAPTGSALFVVSGTSTTGTPTYQWRKDGVAISAMVTPSAATSMLSLSNVQTGDVGSYDCLVSNSCGGSALSNAAMLSLADCGGDPGTCPADFNQDGGVDGSDVSAFFARWESGC